MLAVCLPLLLVTTPPRNEWFRQSLVNVHFDNHSSLLGQGLAPDELTAAFATVPVTMLQVSAQSNGPATYPTNVGLNATGANGFDTIGLFRGLTRKLGRKLVVYMSVDRRPMQLKQHPEWGHLNADGKPQINGEPIVCNRPNRAKKGYLYEQFLPQIRELSAKYQVDGFWFDGDYILPRPCWCANCLAEWQADTGQPAPRQAGEAAWAKWVAWHYERYCEYRRQVAECIHQANDQALYTSNWSWAWTPEPVPDYADTLSGDAWDVRQVHSVCQRWGAQERVPFDIMSYCTPEWRSLDRSYSLQRTWQEGGLTLAHGGVWFIWSFGGSRIPPSGIDITRQCAQWVRDRQPALGPTSSLAAVAVLDSETAWRQGGRTGMDGPAHCAALNLAEGARPADLLNEATLRGNLARYRAVVVPEQLALAPETLALLTRFAEGGGRVLFTGAALRGTGDESATASELLGLKRAQPAGEQPPAVLSIGGRKHHLRGAPVITPTTAKVLLSFTDGRPALCARPLGQGTVAYLAGEAGYPDDGLLAAVLTTLGVGPAYRVEGNGRSPVLCTLRAKGRQTVLHVVDLTARVNAQVTDINTREYTDLNPPLHNLRVTIPCAQQPAGVRVVPTGTMVRSAWQDGRLTLALETLETHAAVIIDTPPAQPWPLLPADTPQSAAQFHPADDFAGVVFADDFERTPVGAAPAKPWQAENKGSTSIRVTDQEPAAGRRTLCFTDQPGSSFWPFLHRSVAPFRHGKAKLSCDVRQEPGVPFYIEVRYEGRGAGPSVFFDGQGKVTASNKALAQLPTGRWHHVEISFELGGDKPGYTVALTPAGGPAQRFEGLPYASDWFYLCDSVYFVGHGEQAGRFYLDNVVLERLP